MNMSVSASYRTDVEFEVLCADRETPVENRGCFFFQFDTMITEEFPL